MKKGLKLSFPKNLRPPVRSKFFGPCFSDLKREYWIKKSFESWQSLRKCQSQSNLKPKPEKVTSGRIFRSSCGYKKTVSGNCDWVIGWQLECMAVGQCGYDSVNMWLCDYDHAAMWLCDYDSMRVWQCDCVTECQCACDYVTRTVDWMITTVWLYACYSVHMTVWQRKCFCDSFTV